MGIDIDTDCTTTSGELQLPRGVRRWWRVPSGLRLPECSAGDVVRYEEQELGNAIGVDPRLLPDLDRLPASRVVWACLTQQAARRYGHIADMESVSGHAIGADGDGGYLVLVVPPAARDGAQ